MSTSDFDEDELFQDFPTAKFSQTKTKKQSEEPKSTSKIKQFFEKSTINFQPGCVICYKPCDSLTRCQKCFLKVCPSCKDSLNFESFNKGISWKCSDCTNGQGSLEVLLDAPSQKSSKRVKQTGKRKSSRKRVDDNSE